ncbi:unnamed protein product [Candida verbasci]|uniref:Coupling of ubiquitin conjugation to ER degradation protein 1 n=1 Tax=Candida verbasci TaxID=1227364 RepID=A0A9W4XN57_9ASCO|nr:unnamed protein product [Candida verbasci]
MDSSTIIFIFTIVIAFIFLRWLISPIPNDLDNTATTNTQRQTTAVGNGSNRLRRPVTDSMIEVVQTIAPSLTVEQIRYDLENTGSVEVTINRYMENNSLPFPPNYQPRLQTSEQQTTNEKPEEVVSNINLFDKYNIDLINPKPQDSMLAQKRQDMIINARKRLEKD